MSVSAAQADAFYREVLHNRAVYTIRDAQGHPAPLTTSGQRAMPFWSRRSRAHEVVDNVAAYRTFTVAEVPLDEWRERWLPGLDRDGLLIGVNWSGRNATGYDLTPVDLLRNLDARAELAS